MKDNEFIVGMGKIAVEKSPAVLASLGLGSCIGVAMLDQARGIGGLAHVMLPKNHLEQSPPLKSALLIINDQMLADRCKLHLNNIGITEQSLTAKDACVKAYQDHTPDIIIFEVVSLAEESYLLEQLKELDINANIILTGNIDDDLRPALYNQDIHIIGKALAPQEFDQTLNLIRNKGTLKYADVAVKSMIELLKARGADPKSLVAKIAGGAKMFQNMADSALTNIGLKNIISVKEALYDQNVSIKAEDTGGGVGRTIRFHLDTGKLEIRTKEGMKVL